MGKTTLQLQCPLSSHMFDQTALPVMSKEKGYTNPIPENMQPFKVECVPYTPDVDKYVLGIAVWFALSLVLYILLGISRIPMDLSPFDNFSKARFLRKLQSYSMQLTLVLFVIVVAIVTILKTSIHMDWLLLWMQIVLAILFAGVGFGVGRGEYFGVAIFYSGFLWWPYIADIQIPEPLGKYLDLQVIIMGVFFNALIVFQFLKADKSITDLLSQAKNKVLGAYQDQIAMLNSQVGQINLKIGPINRGSEEPISEVSEITDITKYTELISQRRDVLSSLESLIALVDKVTNVPFRPSLFRRLPELSLPYIILDRIPVSSGISGG